MDESARVSVAADPAFFAAGGVAPGLGETSGAGGATAGSAVGALAGVGAERGTVSSGVPRSSTTAKAYCGLS